MNEETDPIVRVVRAFLTGFRTFLQESLGSYYNPQANGLLGFSLAVIAFGIVAHSWRVSLAGGGITVMLLYSIYKREQRWRA